jgi:hypothetical protein
VKAFIINDLTATLPALKPLPAVPDRNCNASTVNIYASYAALCTATDRDLAIVPQRRPTSAVIVWLTGDDVTVASALASWAVRRGSFFLLISDISKLGDLVVITHDREGAVDTADEVSAHIDTVHAVRRLAVSYLRTAE